MGLSRQRCGVAPRALAACVFGLAVLSATGEEAAASSDTGPSAGAEEVDPTKELLKKLTISMVSDVVDEHTILIRDSAKAGRKLLRLGNTASPERGSLSEAEHEEKIESSKGALSQLVGKQMIWWKAAADEFQPKSDDDAAEVVVLADLWLMDGKHVNTMLINEGHLAKADHYTEELAKNILTAESDEAKKQAYKDLEEAIKESQKYKAEEAKAAQAKEEADKPAEGIGVGGWIGICSVALMCGAVFIFAPEKKKKVNLNRKRGFFEKIWTKLKGA